MSRRNFFYVDAEGSEVSPNAFRVLPNMTEGTTEPSPGGRVIDTVGWEVINIIFISSDGSPIDTDTLWNWRVTLDGVNWTQSFPQLSATSFTSRNMAVEHVFSFPVDRIIAIEPYVVSWGAGATGDDVHIFVSLS